MNIDYYTSLNSPWAYMGNARFAAIVAKHNCTVSVKPAVFGEIFAATGGLPLPKRSPERRAYRMMELKRWRKHLGIELNLEPAHAMPDQTMGVRLVMATSDAGGDVLSLLTEIGRAVWERDEDISNVDVLAAAAARAGIDNMPDIEDAATAQKCAALHKQYTQEALTAGVFGAPSFVLPDGEVFWGQDRLELLEIAVEASSS